MLGGHVRVISIHHARFVAIRTVITLGLALGSFAASASWAANDSVLNKIVVVGDSLSAGFESFSLFDGETSPFPGAALGQRYGYAAQVAQQAGHGLTLPLFTYPGIPFNILVSAPPFGRINPGVQTNNLSVPGFTVANAISNPVPGTTGIDFMSDVILGTPQFPNTIFGCGPIQIGTSVFVSELTCAIAMRPSLVLVSIGSNDALQSLTLGVPPTDPKVFATQYTAFVAGLAASGAKVVVNNVPDLTTLPYLIPVPIYKSIVCPGAPVPATATNADFMVANLGALDPQHAANLLNPCLNGVLRTADQVAKVGAAVTAYNKTIKQVATAFGASMVDVNGLFATLRASGYPAIGKTLTTNAGGGLFSLDNIHPTATGYAILANTVIDVINSRFQTAIPKVVIDGPSGIAIRDPFALAAP